MTIVGVQDLKGVRRQLMTSVSPHPTPPPCLQPACDTVGSVEPIPEASGSP